MKHNITIAIMVLFIMGIALAETSPFLYDYVKNDWFSIQSAEEAILPEGLTDRETEIYRAAYANGFYDALHPVYIEGTYVLNTKTKKFHLTNCPSTLLIESNNREYSTLSSTELMDNKFKPCGQCHPERQTTEQNETTE